VEIYQLTAHELKALMERGEVRAVEVVQAFFKRIEQVEDKVKAFITLTPEQALEQARAVDETRREGRDPGCLAGIPIALKDNLCTEGLTTTCGSRILAHWQPPLEATAVSRLRKAGAVILGKLNLDEFAMGTTTQTSAFYPTRNPWDLGRVPGGSSGGPAAAVAAGETPLALGSDTGGSVRQPAAFCGIVGLRPTYGRVSRWGLVALASSMDQIGPLARDVTDCALVLEVIAGRDPLDPTSLPIDPEPYSKALVPQVQGIKVGIPREYLERAEPGVKEGVAQALKRLEELGARCEEISLPHLEPALVAYHIIAAAEASSNLARFDGLNFGLRVSGRDVEEMYCNTRGQGLGPEVKKRLILGTYFLSKGRYQDYYLKAVKIRTLILQDFRKAWERFDLLATPTTPTVALPFREETFPPLENYHSDIFTIPPSLAGLPALSLPCGWSQGLPVGLQLIGKPLQEPLLLQVAYTLEQAIEFRRARPILEVS